MSKACLLLFALILAVPAPGLAQQRDVDYLFTFLTDWPPELQGVVPPDPDDDALYPYDLLPFVDTLALGYVPRVFEGQPFLDLRLDWQPGAYGVYDDVLMRFDELPADVRIVAVDLRADVLVRGDSVATLHLALDSLALAPWPEVFAWVRVPTWGTLFADTPADAARRYVDEGFTLGGLEVERIAFAAYDAGDEDEDRVIYDPRYPTGIGVYPPRVGIWVDWILWPRATGKRRVGRDRGEPREGIGRDVPADGDDDRTRTGRDGEGDDRATPDRPATERDDDEREGRARPRPGKTDKDDDDDDDEDLLPAALAGAAAIGVLAYFGRSIGYYGNSEAPFGLSAGYVEPRGGALLQVAVNDAVLGIGDRERLLAKVTAFYDFFRTPLQPAAGLGVLAEEAGDDVELSPTLSIGAVGNFGLVVLYGGYDAGTGGVDFSLVFNLRHKRR